MSGAVDGYGYTLPHTRTRHRPTLRLASRAPAVYCPLAPQSACHPGHRRRRSRRAADAAQHAGGARDAEELCEHRRAQHRVEPTGQRERTSSNTSARAGTCAAREEQDGWDIINCARTLARRSGLSLASYSGAVLRRVVGRSAERSCTGASTSTTWLVLILAPLYLARRQLAGRQTLVPEQDDNHDFNRL